MSIFFMALIVTNLSAFAISSQTILSVKADKKIIDANRGVTITGYVSPSIIRNGENLSIKVFNPVGDLYFSDSLNLTNTLIATNTYSMVLISMENQPYLATMKLW